MSTVELSETTYRLLQRQAQDQAQTPDQLADVLLRERLLPQHAYVAVVQRFSGPRAVIKGTRITVSDIVAYLQAGETPESITTKILPDLTLAQVHDALGYYDDHRADIDQEITANSEERSRAYPRERLGEDGYRLITGQTQ